MVRSIGDDSVVIGEVAEGLEVGNRSVYVGATDSRGNTFLTQTMAVGFGARASDGSIAIGAHALAGTAALTTQFPKELQAGFEALSKLAAENRKLADALSHLAAEADKGDPGLIHKAWEAVSVIATASGAYGALASATPAIVTFLSGLSS